MNFNEFNEMHRAIRGAIALLRTCNSPIISATAIDFIKKASFDKLKNMESINKIKTKAKERQK